MRGFDAILLRAFNALATYVLAESDESRKESDLKRAEMLFTAALRLGQDGLAEGRGFSFVSVVLGSVETDVAGFSLVLIICWIKAQLGFDALRLGELLRDPRVQSPWKHQPTC